MEKGNTFQLVVLGFFIAATLIAVFVLATGGTDENQVTPITVWGTQDAEIFSAISTQHKDDILSAFEVTYREIRSEEFDTVLVEAIAEGTGPDVILLPSDSIISHQNKISPIPFESYSERQFRDLFIENGELYVSGDGIIALPLSVDPMVMYWNRDLFSNAGIARPPSYWDELPQVVQRITETDQARNVLLSTIPFGEYQNVAHAKDILAMLFLQAGITITERTSPGSSDILEVRLESNDNALRPAQSVLDFYTEFSNPVNSVYTWNRSLPNSEELFLQGDLALYFGYASEVDTLRAKNPNLNFDVTLVPQIRGIDRNRTFGKMQALAVLRTARAPQAAFNYVYAMTNPEVHSVVVEESGLPPVLRSLLADRPSGAVETTFYNSALVSDNWLDPAPEESASVFRDMIEDVTSGRLRVSEAIREASKALDQIE